MPSNKLERVNALAELERLQWTFEPAGEDEVRVACPAHGDNKPSASMNVKKNLWRCHAAGCGAYGDIATFLAYALETERSVILHDLRTRYDIEDTKTINPSLNEKYHAGIWDAGPLLKAIRDRGVTDDMIRKHRLGYWRGRITIPIYDEHGQIVNVRRYLPGAKGPDKMQNTRGYGSPPRIFLPEQLKYEKLWICGGELKAMVAASILNQFDTGAVAPATGEGVWRPEWTPKLRNKIVYLCFDVDKAGLVAINAVAQLIFRAVRELYVIAPPR
jgi:hypothetical protein